jgi:hypothetical protein
MATTAAAASTCATYHDPFGTGAAPELTDELWASDRDLGNLVGLMRKTTLMPFDVVELTASYLTKRELTGIDFITANIEKISSVVTRAFLNASCVEWLGMPPESYEALHEPETRMVPWQSDERFSFNAYACGMRFFPTETLSESIPELMRTEFIRLMNHRNRRTTQHDHEAVVTIDFITSTSRKASALLEAIIGSDKSVSDRASTAGRTVFSNRWINHLILTNCPRNLDIAALKGATLQIFSIGMQGSENFARTVLDVASKFPNKKMVILLTLAPLFVATLPNFFAHVDTGIITVFTSTPGTPSLVPTTIIPPFVTNNPAIQALWNEDKPVELCRHYIDMIDRPPVIAKFSNSALKRKRRD